MENPIKNNRLVSDQTFAIRLNNFLKDLQVNDASSFEEKEYFQTVANDLIRYQCLTASEKEEINYLIMMNVYHENVTPIFVTEDGKAIFYDDKIELYSCLKTPGNGDSILKISSNKVLKDLKRYIERGNRVYFIDLQKCKDYMDYNTPKYSQRDIDEIKRNGCSLSDSNGNKEILPNYFEKILVSNDNVNWAEKFFNTKIDNRIIVSDSSSILTAKNEVFKYYKRIKETE